MNQDVADDRADGESGDRRAERPNFLTAARFSDFDLPPEILAGVDQAGFEYCTPIQTQAIPVAMKGLDIAGQAQTGTGKTTAFLLPLMNRLLKNKPLEPNAPRALIITPTRELAQQIHEDALILAGASALRQALIIGGVEYREQAELLGTAPEIVIGTPGRLIDYLKQGIFKTSGVEVAVVDEADRLLDMGFIKDLKYILGRLPPYSQRQTMLFSATLDQRILELTYEFMNPPQFITAEPDKSAKLKIEQELYHVGREEKLPLLMGLLRREPHRRVMIFANTKSGVEWLARKLAANGFQAEGITGDLPQPKRLKLMEAFKDNRLQILAATDVASRGIHVDDVSHVYNYDLPQDAENYIHRIGRTARAGREGKAVSFGCEDYVFHLEAIENLLGEKIPVFWAESSWFQEDQGGEVRLRDRGDRRKTGGRESRGDGPRASSARGASPRGASPRGASPRGAARSQRAGGIFGLAPRQTGEEDERRSLNWASPPPAQEVELVESAEEQTPEEGRRRRRRNRRGRRGREAAAPPPASAPSGPAETAPTRPEAIIEIKIQEEPAAVKPKAAKPPAAKSAGRKAASPKTPAGQGASLAPEPAATPERPPARRGRPPKSRAAASQPAAEQPMVEQPLAEQPMAERPTTEQPMVEQPAVEQPAAKPSRGRARRASAEGMAGAGRNENQAAPEKQASPKKRAAAGGKRPGRPRIKKETPETGSQDQ